MVPRDGRTPGQKRPEKPERSSRLASSDSFHFLDEATIKKHFKLPPRALYLDPFRRPLITFPINEDDIPNFSMDRKAKINQMILDGLLPASAAISAPSVFVSLFVTFNDRLIRIVTYGTAHTRPSDHKLGRTCEMGVRQRQI